MIDLFNRLGIIVGKMAKNDIQGKDGAEYLVSGHNLVGKFYEIYLVIWRNMFIFVDEIGANASNTILISKWER